MYTFNFNFHLDVDLIKLVFPTVCKYEYIYLTFHNGYRSVFKWFATLIAKLEVVDSELRTYIV